MYDLKIGKKNSFKFITPPENGAQVIFRFFSTLIVWPLAKTKVTPNQVTSVRAVIAIGYLYLFSLGTPISMLWAVALFYIFEILDHVDGDLARYTKQFSKTGPLLEQFIDTWSSRPSNLFGFCVALGMYNQRHDILGFKLFGLTVLGRLLWLEYRDYFGWERIAKGGPKKYQGILDAPNFQMGSRNLFEVLYIWNNSFLLAGALFYWPISQIFGVDSLAIGFAAVALLNNLPWIFIVLKGFARATSSGANSGS